jgi:hypothetical protein
MVDGSELDSLFRKVPNWKPTADLENHLKDTASIFRIFQTEISTESEIGERTVDFTDRKTLKLCTAESV